MAKVLVTGAGGLLAPFVAEAASRLGQVVTLARNHGDLRCDLGDPQAAAAAIAEVAPDFVFHLAGLTDVDGCERDPELADRLNRATMTNIVAALRGAGRLVYVSTDQVYPDTPGPHAEDEVGPINVYGRSKLDGEAAAQAHSHVLILRTNFFGRSRTPNRHSLSDFVISNLTAGNPIELFTDVLFSPLHAATLGAEMTAAATAGMTGIYNLGCREGASKAAFARAVAAHFELSPTSARDIVSSDVARRTKRTLDLRLDVRAVEARLGYAMPTLSEEINKL